MSQRSRLLRQIVRALAPSHPELEAERRDQVEDAVVDFVGAQIGSLPSFMRIPYGAALLGFDCLAVLRYGRPYTRLDPDQSRVYLAIWDAVPIGVFRDFVKLLRSCTLLAYLDHPIVTRELELAAEPESEP
jgi:hypothetical protein